MSFTNIKMLNESFDQKKNDITKIEISEDIINRRIYECKKRLIELKEQYDEIKSNYQSICRDSEALSFGRQLAGGMLAESFNKAIEDLKLEYQDTKTSLQYFKDLKNKTLLEADLTISGDALFDPDKPINFKDLAKERDQLAAEKKAQEEADMKKQELINKASDIKQAIQDSDEPFETAFDLLVPESGNCETVAGEMIRAMMRLLYRDYNDGDLFYEGYGLETAAPAASYLMENGYWDEFEVILNKELRDDDYTDALEQIKDKIIQDILDGDTLTQLNNDDMLSYSTDWIEENQPKYDFELSVDNDIVLQHIENNNCDSWKLKDYVEEVLSWESETRDAEIETPWSHYDTSITVTNLTKDGLERLEEIVRHGHVWDDLAEQLSEEFGDPFEYEEDETDFDDEEDDLDECVKPVQESSQSLEEKTGNRLLDSFLELYDKVKNSPIKSRIDRILNEYGDISTLDNLVNVFKTVSENDQLRILELAAKN